MNSLSADRTRHSPPANDASTNTDILHASESPACEEAAPATKPEVTCASAYNQEPLASRQREIVVRAIGNSERDLSSGPQPMPNDLSEDNADSDCTEFVPETSTEDLKILIIWLEVYWECMDRICMFKGMADPATQPNVLSLLIGTQILGAGRIKGLPKTKELYATPYSDEVTRLLGPVPLKFRPRDSRSKTRYEALFYIFPGKARFDCLLSLEVLRRLGWYSG